MKGGMLSGDTRPIFVVLSSCVSDYLKFCTVLNPFQGDYFG